MIAPPYASPAPVGAGTHCDAPAVPEREISPRLRTGNSAQSQPGDAIAGGQSPRERHNEYQMISHENAHDACGHRHTEWKF